MAEKKYYKISEVSRITGVEPHVLRYWEREFGQIRPRRVRGQRLYTKRHLDIILEIKRLLYEEGFTISGARKRLEESPEKRGITLSEIRQELLELYTILTDGNQDS